MILLIVLFYLVGCVSVGFRLRNKWIILLGTVFSFPAEKLAAQTYTIHIDFSKAVTGYTASDGRNFYVLSEYAGDQCIKCLGTEEVLLQRSIAFQSHKAAVAELIANHNAELSAEKEKTALAQQQSIIWENKYNTEVQTSKDLQAKSENWQKRYRQQRAYKMGNIFLGALGGALITTLVLNNR